MQIAFVCILVLFLQNALGLRLSNGKVCNFVILPGFGNDMMDYIDPPIEPKVEGMVSCLAKRGISATVVPISRPQWLNIAKGVFSLDFWRGVSKPEDLFSFYYKAVDETVRDVVNRTNNPVVLVGHSAGGWLARGIIGDGQWLGSQTRTSELVSGLVTLGAPHFPPREGTQDMARGCLKYVNKAFPGAFLKNEIFYITVAGSAVTSDSSAPENSLAKFAYQSYEIVTGESGPAIGDGVVPLSSAHLEGALQITLPGVYHSINAPGNLWYGGDAVIDQWLPQVRSKLRTSSSSRREFSWFNW
eukprot:gene11419-23891_t